MSWKQDWIGREIPTEEWPIVDENPNWIVRGCSRLSACDNRPGLKKIRVWVYDADGTLLGGIKVRMDVEPSNTGTAYDHLNVWQLTGSREGREGYWEWEHLGIPTRYVLWMEDDEMPLIENIKTDLGYEYCQPGRWPWNRRGYNAINRPGVYSYCIEIHQK